MLWNVHNATTVLRQFVSCSPRCSHRTELWLSKFCDYFLQATWFHPDLNQLLQVRATMNGINPLAFSSSSPNRQRLCWTCSTQRLRNNAPVPEVWYGWLKKIMAIWTVVDWLFFVPYVLATLVLKVMILDIASACCDSFMVFGNDTRTACVECRRFCGDVQRTYHCITLIYLSVPSSTAPKKFTIEDFDRDGLKWPGKVCFFRSLLNSFTMLLENLVPHKASHPSCICMTNAIN